MPISEMGKASRRTTNCGKPFETLASRISQPSRLLVFGTSTWKNCHFPAGTLVRIAEPPSSVNGSAVSGRVTSVKLPKGLVGL